VKLQVRDLVYIFTGTKSKRYGTVPKQVVSPTRINLISGTITCSVCNAEGRKYFGAFSADRFEVFSHDDPAAVLYRPTTLE
jgi:hypothetical protein